MTKNAMSAIVLCLMFLSGNASAQSNSSDACVSTLDSMTISACDAAIQINPTAGKFYYHRAFARIFFDTEDARLKSDFVSALKLEPAYVPNAMKILKYYADWDTKNGKNKQCYIGFSFYSLTGGKPISNSLHAAWVKEALDQSHVDGCNITRRAVGIAHLNGTFGFPKDSKISIDQFEECYFWNSEGDGRKACSLILAQIYRDGVLGVIPDFEESYAWFLVSCAEGNEVACSEASDLKRSLSNSSVQKSQQLAKELKVDLK